MAKECTHTADFCRSLRAQGALVYPNVASKLTPKGWPDRSIVCPWGLQILVELKDETTRVRPEQKEQLAKLESMNSPAWVVRFMSSDEEHHPVRFEDSNGFVVWPQVRWGLFFEAVKELV